MKKFLLILLSLILILLPSCNLSSNDDETEKFITSGAFSYPKIELSEEGERELKSKIASVNCRDIDVSGAETNISIVSAKVIGVNSSFLQNTTNIEQPSNFNLDTKVLEINNIIILGEDILYTEKEYKYVYLFFEIMGGASNLITKCNKAMLSEGEFSFDFNNALPEGSIVIGEEYSDLIILKIDSSSLEGDLRTAKVTVTKDTPILESLSSVSITDAEKMEIQSILAGAEQIDIDGDAFVKAIYHTPRSEKLSFMADQESVSCNLQYEPVIIDERDIFDGISESQYMYLFFNYTDDGKAYKEGYDSAYNFRVGSYTQGFSDAVCFVFNREITAEVSCTAPSERMAIIKMPIVEDVDLFEVRLYKYYENELASIKDMIQDPTPSVRYKLPDVSDMAGNLKVESCFFDIKDNYILPEEIFVYNQDKYSENALIYTEKELFPESEEENLYLLFSFELSSDRAYTLIGDSANLNSGIVELKFKLVESGGDDAFTKYVVMLKLNGSNGTEQITDLHLEIGYIPYSEYN